MNNNVQDSKIELMRDFFSDDTDDSDLSIERLFQFNELMMKYNSAIREIKTKLEILNDELSLQGNKNPIESIYSRIKKPLSIAEKLKKLGKKITIDSIVDNLNDVAGIRIICPFIDDIYKVVDMLIVQDDITLIQTKDYIKNPKLNGYRSYHMIVEVPVFFSKYKQPMRVEIQIRTVAMDFWASLEHQIKYKNDSENTQEIVSELKACANVIANTDLKMLELRKRIDKEE